MLARYHQPLLAAAAFAGAGLVTGGQDPARRNVTTPLVRALAGGTGLPRLVYQPTASTGYRYVLPSVPADPTEQA